MSIDSHFEGAVLAELRLRQFRAVAWLHRGLAADVTPRALTIVGVAKDEIAAVAIEDRLDGSRPSGETLTALHLWRIRGSRHQCQQAPRTAPTP